MITKLIPTLFLSCVLTINSQLIGNKCTIQETGKPGSCKWFSDCKTAQTSLKKGIFPQLCRTNQTKREYIVCCEREPGEISKQKCIDYASFAIEKRKVPILLINGPVIEKHNCEHSAAKLIVGGTETGRKEFPHMAAIGFEIDGEPQYMCGGTILSELYILTAAHCLSDHRFGNAMFVLLGDTNLKSHQTTHRQLIKVKETKAYPDYNISSFYHDIGLIKLEKAAILTPYVRPACLYLHSEIQSTTVVATGWGLTQTAGEPSSTLRKVTLNLIEHNRCNSYFKKFGKIRKLSRYVQDDIQFCAGYEKKDENRDTCQGDSGGPLQILHTDLDAKCMYDIVGITSGGTPGCSGVGSFYVRVSYYVGWIENIVWP